MVGRHAEQFPDLARLVARAGFGVGNHTYTHSRLALAGPARTAWELAAAHEAIQRASGVSPKCFRAPHGYRNPFLRRLLSSHGYQIFGWTLGVWDTARPGAAVIRRRVAEGVSPGAILLLHDGDGFNPHGDRCQTADALPGILADCQAMGYGFRSLDELATR
jgi:peptidoglycan/xylan/chitin deacetylase (PgdA/CDA1 family)